jgi:hypothetical protein
VIQFSMYRNYLQDLQIMKKRFPIFFSFDIVFTGVLLSSVFFLSFFIPLTLFSQTFAAAPVFDQVLIYDKEISNQKNDWVQTSDNDSANLRSDPVDLLAVDYHSDGKTLDITFWVKSNSENASLYNQPFKKIRYGVLIAIVSLPQNSGYNGANFNYYVEAVDGKWSEYLYQLSSTGTSALLESKTNYTEPLGNPIIGPGYVKLRLNLDSIHSPSNYGLSFYTAESFKSSEVRDFTSWVAVPSPVIDILTHPENIVIRQGEKKIIPTEIETPLSNNVTKIAFEYGTNFSSNGLSVSAQRIQPPLFEVEVSPQSPVGVYKVPFEASMLVQTTSSTSPMFNNTVTEIVDPEFQVSKKYPTTGDIIGKGNLTIEVIPPLTVNEEFMAFWNTYGTPLVILGSGAAGVFATFFIDYIKSVKSRREHK